jgi:calcineurin-like phosphoesterase family protein
VNDRWFISDSHFGHANLLKLTRHDGSPLRPGFRDADQMDEVMIEKWNAVVKPADVVHHLGDICFDQKHLTGILPRLNGNIYLVLGNHDRLDTGFYDKHFKKVRGWFHYTEPGAAMVCTHCPLHESSFLGRYEGNCINVHGHIHARVIRDPNYVSVEQIDYTPVHYDTLMAKARRMAA